MARQTVLICDVCREPVPALLTMSLIKDVGLRTGTTVRKTYRRFGRIEVCDECCARLTGQDHAALALWADDTKERLRAKAKAKDANAAALLACGCDPDEMDGRWHQKYHEK